MTPEARILLGRRGDDPTAKLDGVTPPTVQHVLDAIDPATDADRKRPAKHCTGATVGQRLDDLRARLAEFPPNASTSDGDAFLWAVRATAELLALPGERVPIGV